MRYAGSPHSRLFKLLLSFTLIFGSSLGGLSAKEIPQQQDDITMVTMTTSMGTITIELDADKAPVTVENFLAYVDNGHYDGTIFHRVIPGFVIQGGGMVPGMQQKKTGSPIQNEADNGLKNLTGAICMARTNDPHSATSQFFINLKDNTFLDHKDKSPEGWGYAVFGHVTSGMDVVEQIAAVETGNIGHHSDVPLEDVVLQKVDLVID